MAGEREIRIKLVIDGKESESTLQLTSNEVNELRNTIAKLGQDGSSVYKSLVQEAFKYNQTNEQSVNSLYEWMKTQNITSDIIEQVIADLDKESNSLNINTSQWQQTQAAIQNISIAKSKLIQANLGLTSTNAQIIPGQQKLNMAMGQFGYVLNDAQVFMINFRMGLMSISNNLPTIIQLFISAKQEIEATGGSISKSLVAALSGPGGLMIALNGVMLLLTLLPSLFDDTTDSVKSQKKNVDELKSSYEKMTRAQLDNAMTEKELELAKLKAKEQTATYTTPGGEAGHKLLPTKEGGLSQDEKERIKELEKEIKLINDIALKTGDREEVSRRININEERLNRLQTATLNNYKDIIDKYNLGNLSLEEQKEKVKEVLQSWINADRELNKDTSNQVDKVFENELEKLKIVQSHQEKMAQLTSQSDYEILLQKEEHLNQMLELYKKYNKDISELLLQQEEINAEKKTYADKPTNKQQDLNREEYLNDIGPDLELEAMSQEDLAKLKIESIENEWERKRALADWEYNENLKKYQNYENYEQIKTELDKQHAQTRKQIAAEEATTKLQILSGNLQSIKGLFGEHTLAYKAITVFQTLIDTYQAATAAYKSTAEIPIVGPFLAPAAAAAATAFGLSKVASIDKAKVPGYEKGGFGIVGEKGVEVIAPLKDYAQGQADLITSTLIALENTLLDKRYSAIFSRNDFELKDILEKNFNKFQSNLESINSWQRQINFKIDGYDLVTVKDMVEERKTEMEY